MNAAELNLDGLIGPTHNYAGLAHGNRASQAHGQSVAFPRAAALQGLNKMRQVMALGIPQAVLPPQDRPDVRWLRQVGFSGDDAGVIEQAAAWAPHLLAIASSASSMWAANAATVCPSAESADGRVHFTPANLVSHAHRAMETCSTAHLLRAIFPQGVHFTHHDPLPADLAFADEGAANHTRLCSAFGEAGVQLLVFGRDADPRAGHRSRRYFARQSRQACEALIRLHGLSPDRVVVARQHPEAIDAGVFHNDVIAVGHRHVLLVHEKAWVNQSAVIDSLQRSFDRLPGPSLVVLEVAEHELALSQAVSSYLFNSQLLSTGDGSIGLLCPTECEVGPARAVIDRLVGGDGPIRWARFVDIRQSMRNGGGPACLRLRVELTAAQQAAMHPGVRLTPELADALEAWVTRHYRTELAPADLADPALLAESRVALDELTGLLGLGAMYAFQT